jgi:hypothetical protein
MYFILVLRSSVVENKATGRHVLAPSRLSFSRLLTKIGSYFTVMSSVVEYARMLKE